MPTPRNATAAEMRSRLQKLTKGCNPAETTLLRRKGQLAQAVRAAIIDWETGYDRMEYTGPIEDGEVFRDSERKDLVQKIFHAMRGLVW